MVECLAIDPSNTRILYAGTSGRGVFKLIPNEPPIFTNLPRTESVQAGISYSFQILANDPDRDLLTFSLVTGTPSGMSVGSSSGFLSWNPTVAGNYAITIGVSDGINPTVVSTLTLNVNAPPTITATVTPTTINRGQSATLSWTSTNATTMSISPGIGSVPVSGSRTVSPTSTTYVFTASGAGGNTSASVALIVTDPSPPPEPRTVELKIGSTIYRVDGVSKVMDAAPYIEEGRTMVPVRFLAEGLGGTVDWDGATKIVTVRFINPLVEIKLTIGSHIAIVNGKFVAIDITNPRVVPVIKNNRTFVPLRFLVESIPGSSIEWVPPDTVVMKLPR
ncbi:MAG: hypothetical protein DDT22_00761 [candidate division WS2 bacterium]|nr:hypothetical protein [Candidatus Lithacetigena glycinireducens]